MADIYWNLNRHCFSIKERGRPVQHAREAALRNARFVVQRAGYEATIRNRCKCVHAMVRGELCEPGAVEGEAVTYNPYRADHFQLRDTGERIEAARYVAFTIAPDGKPIVKAIR